jgi:hypothetical protein
MLVFMIYFKEDRFNSIARLKNPASKIWLHFALKRQEEAKRCNVCRTTWKDLVLHASNK